MNKGPDQTDQARAGTLPDHPLTGASMTVAKVDTEALARRMATEAHLDDLIKGGALARVASDPHHAAAALAVLGAQTPTDALGLTSKAVDGWKKATNSSAPVRSFEDIVYGALDVMQSRATGFDVPIPTPWASVNAKIRGGFWPGLYTLSSGTGQGKTQWAIQCALHAAEAFARYASEETIRTGDAVKPSRVAYIALELGPVDLVARLLGVMAAGIADKMRAAGNREDEIRQKMTDAGLHRLKWSDLFFGVDPDTKVPNEQSQRIVAHVRKILAPTLAALPIHVETAAALGWTYTSLEKLVNEQKPSFVVIDYSQLVSAPEGAREELRTTIGNVAKVARDLARRPDGPAILALSSTARANYGSVNGTDEKSTPLGQGDPARLVGLGKDSGDLEFTADCVLALGRSALPENPPDIAAALAECQSWLAIAKGRGFPSGWVPMKFDGSKFTESEMPVRDSKAAEPRAGKPKEGYNRFEDQG